jgi:folylpolyglutamate synthase
LFELNRTHPRILIFNQQGRAEALDFLDSIHQIARSSRPSSRPEDQPSQPPFPAFEHVVFCTNVTYTKTGYKRDFVHRGYDPREIEAMTQQRRFAEKWALLDPGADVRVLPTIEEALDFARALAGGLPEGQVLQAFVTGSLHLVGGALGILEKADAL